MNDKLKRILAILGIIFLLAVFALPMFFAGRSGENSRNAFLGAVALAVFIPILVYVVMQAFKIFGPKTKKAGKIRNVVFDIGNVLMKFGWESYLDSYGFDSEKREKIADAVFRNDLWNERDRGILTEEECEQKFVDLLPEYEEDIREVVGRSGESITLLPYSVSWLRYLKEQGYGTYILSNYSEYGLEKTKKDMEFLKYVDGAVFSCEEKVIKPEPEIFRILFKRYGLKPEECVFIDDRRDNVEAAMELGMKGIVFTDFKSAAAELEKMGIK